VLARFRYLERGLTTIATHTVTRLRLEGPDGEGTDIESDGPAALMIRRVEFDALLVRLAQEAGAELVTGADIVRASEANGTIALESRDGRRFEASMVIAADGVYSVVARRLGIHRGWPASRVALDMMEETGRERLRDVDPARIWVAYGFEPGGVGRNGDRRAAEGYAYVFPKRDHVNIGIGYVLSHFREAVGGRPYELQRGIVDYLRRRELVAGASVRENFTPYAIPVGGPLRRPGRGCVLLAGDAGGFVNGVTAEGIYYAMVTGDLAARTIIDTGREAAASMAARYRRACDDEIGAELRDAVLLQRYLFADRRRIARVISGARTDPATTRKVLDFAVGRLTYRELRRGLLMQSPLLAGRLLWERLRTMLVPARQTT
jgi:flavin-dependent dehydrogenase